MDPITLLGVTGAALILLGFSMNQLGKWSVDSLWYDSINLLGGLLLLSYSLLIGSVPFAILNLVWIAVALKDVVTALLKRRKS